MKVVSHPEAIVIEGAHFSLTFDQTRGGELTEVRLFDGSQWNELLGSEETSYPLVRLRGEGAEFRLYHDDAATLEPLHEENGIATVVARGRPKTADGRDSGWQVTLRYEIHAEGAVFTDIEYEWPEGAFELDESTVGLVVNDQIRNAPRFADVNISKKWTIRGLEPARVAFGKNPERSFTNDLEAGVQRNAPKAGETDFRKDAGRGRFAWVLGGGKTIEGPFHYENTLALGLGAAIAGSDRTNGIGHRIFHWINFAAQPVHVMRIMQAYEGRELTRDVALEILRDIVGTGPHYWWPREPAHLEEVLTLIQETGYSPTRTDGLAISSAVTGRNGWHPSREIIDRIVERHGTVLALHHEWMLHRGTNGDPHARYDLARNEEELKQMIAYAHERGLRVLLYMRGVEDYALDESPNFFEKYLRRDWDGVYVDWAGAAGRSAHESRVPPETGIGDRHFSDDGTYMPYREYFQFCKRLREIVGPKGLVINHVGSMNTGVLANLAVDGDTAGETDVTRLMFSSLDDIEESPDLTNFSRDVLERTPLQTDADLAVYTSMQAGGAIFPWSTDAIDMKTPQAAAKMAAWGYYPHVTLGFEIEKSNVFHPQDPAHPHHDWVQPYFRVLAHIDLARPVAVFNMPSQSRIVVRNSNPAIHSIVYRQGPDRFLVISANLSDEGASAKLELDREALGMSGEGLTVYAISSATGEKAERGPGTGALTTSELPPWGIEGHLILGTE